MSAIERVWYRSFTLPTTKNSMPVMIPWAIMPKIAALMPVGVSVAMPSITKPMWPTELNAMRRLRSLCARQHSAPYRIAIVASTASTGAQNTAPSGRMGRAIRTKP